MWKNLKEFEYIMLTAFTMGLFGAVIWLILITVLFSTLWIFGVRNF